MVKNVKTNHVVHKPSAIDPKRMVKLMEWLSKHDLLVWNKTYGHFRKSTFREINLPLWNKTYGHFEKEINL